MTTHVENHTILLIAGHWLGAWAWDEVLVELTALGHRAVALTLPGLDPNDPERSTRTLNEQVACIEEAMDATDSQVVIVGHSGANAPVSLVIDRRPERVLRVVWVDSGPVASGTVFAPDARADLALPHFEALGQQASLDGLDAEMLERFRALAVPQPASVLRRPVDLHDDARRDVPTTLVCCSLPSAQIQELARAGHPVFAEVALLRNADFVDLPTGHWPMWSRPAGLAQVIVSPMTSITTSTATITNTNPTSSSGLPC